MSLSRLQAVRGDAKLARRWRVCVSPRRRRETLPRTHRLEEVDLCNETLARLELLEQEDSITSLYELMARTTSPRRASSPTRRASDAVIGAGVPRPASPPRSPRRPADALLQNGQGSTPGAESAAAC